MSTQEESKSKRVSRVINLKLRERDTLMFEFLSERDFTTGDIFRLGMLTAIEGIKNNSVDNRFEDIWKDIAKIAILK